MLALFAFLFETWTPAPTAPVFTTYAPSKTYPRFSQPILTHPDGSRWYLEVTNAGVLQIGGRTLDVATPMRDVQLIDSTNVSAYRLSVTGAVPPLLQTIPLRDPAMGYHKDLPVWSVNGREWTIHVSQAGAISVVGASSNWDLSPHFGSPTDTPAPHLQQPQIGIDSLRFIDGFTAADAILDEHGAPILPEHGDLILTEAALAHPVLADVGPTHWRVGMTDNGLWTVTERNEATKHLGNARLWTQDDTMPFEIVINQDGILTVIDAPADTPRRYELVLVSPGGTYFTLVGNSVSGDIILSVTSTLYDAMNAREEWPLVISQHGNYLYIADDRFPPPLPGVGRRWGQRKRQPRRSA